MPSFLAVRFVIAFSSSLSFSLLFIAFVLPHPSSSLRSPNYPFSRSSSHRRTRRPYRSLVVHLPSQLALAVDLIFLTFILILSLPSLTPLPLALLSPYLPFLPRFLTILITITIFPFHLHPAF